MSEKTYTLTPIKSKLDLSIKKIIPSSGALKEENIIGFDIGKWPSYHIFALAPTNSGKTTALMSFIKKIIDKNTIIHVFCHTVNSDPAWLDFQTFMKKGKQSPDTMASERLVIYNNVREDLPALLDNFRAEAARIKAEKEAEENEDAQRVKPRGAIDSNSINIVGASFEDDKVKIRVKKIKPKKDSLRVAAKHIIIFDDISREIKDNIYYQELLKESRHFGARVITSSQNGLDLDPASRQQLKILMLFGGIPQTKLKQLHSSMNILPDLSYEEFVEVYKTCTSKKYDFMTLYIPEQEVRCCFDQKITF